MGILENLINAVAVMDPKNHSWREVPKSDELIKVAEKSGMQRPVLASNYSSVEEAVKCSQILEKYNIPVIVFDYYESAKESIRILSEQGQLEDYPDLPGLVKAFEEGKLEPIRYILLANEAEFKKSLIELRNDGVNTNILAVKDVVLNNLFIQSTLGRSFQGVWSLS